MSTVYLKDKKTRELIEGRLLDEMTTDAVILAHASWQPWLDKRRQELVEERVPKIDWPQHLHWDWEGKARSVEGLLSYRTLGIELLGAIQGMMLTALDGKLSRLMEQKAKPLVYIHFLASAPWNSPSLVAEPRFSLVGRVLLAAAIQLSLDQDYRGRIGLHSLPQSEAFYRACGMTDLDVDLNAQGLRYFEMTSKQAASFLN